MADSQTLNNRVRAENAAQLSIAGTFINPMYVSIVADQKPVDYVAYTGQQRGMYPLSNGGLQMVIWNTQTNEWDDYGEAFSSLEYVDDKASLSTVLVVASDAPEIQKRAADFVCDGEDDHLVISAAFTSHPNVRLSEGNFYLGNSGDQITGMPQGFHLIGAGFGKTILHMGDGGVLGNIIRPTNLDNWKISGLQFNLNKANRPGTFDDAIQFGSANNWLIEDCWGYDSTGNIIRIDNNVHNGIIRRCILARCDDDGLDITPKVSGGASRIDVENCLAYGNTKVVEGGGFSGAGGSGFECDDGAKNITFRNCHAWDNAVGFDIHKHADDPIPGDIKIIGGSAISNGMAVAVGNLTFAPQAHDVMIDGLLIDGTLFNTDSRRGKAVLVWSSSNVTVQNCTIRDCSNGAIRIEDQDHEGVHYPVNNVKILNNTFENIRAGEGPGYAIWCRSDGIESRGLVIDNNTFDGVEDSAIHIRDKFISPKVTNNNFINCVTEGGAPIVNILNADVSRAQLKGNVYKQGGNGQATYAIRNNGTLTQIRSGNDFDDVENFVSGQIDNTVAASETSIIEGNINYIVPYVQDHPDIVESFEFFDGEGVDFYELEIPDSKFINLLINRIQSDTNDVTLRMQVSSDGGATWSDGSTDYKWVRQQLESDAADQGGNSSGDDGIDICSRISTEAGNRHQNLKITVSDPHVARRTKFAWSGSVGRFEIGMLQGAGMRSSNEKTDRVRFFLSSGKITLLHLQTVSYNRLPE